NSRLCPQCAAAQAMTCSACQHANPPGSRFCSQCGAKLEAAQLSKPTAVPSAERRQLTVMFCDLVGSTARSTQLDPEDLREVIGTSHKFMADVCVSSQRLLAQYL